MENASEINLLRIITVVTTYIIPSEKIYHSPADVSSKQQHKETLEQHWTELCELQKDEIRNKTSTEPEKPKFAISNAQAKQRDGFLDAKGNNAEAVLGPNKTRCRR